MKYVQSAIRSLRVNKGSSIQAEELGNSKSVGIKNSETVFRFRASINLALSFRRRIRSALPVVGMVSL